MSIVFKRWYAEILEMVRNALLLLARQIVRKSLVRPNGSALGSTPDLLAQFSEVSLDGGLPDPEGYPITYGYISSWYPLAPVSFGFSNFMDWTGVREIKMLVTITRASTVDGAHIQYEMYDIPNGFLDIVDSLPSVPLDEVGAHVTDWMSIPWPSSDRAIEGYWAVYNPAATEAPNFAVGLCQLWGR